MLKDGDKVIGHQIKIKVVKNKVSAPFREGVIEMYYGSGLSRESDLIELGLEQGLIEKSGSWYSFEGQRIGQGRENVRAHLVWHRRRQPSDWKMP